jgi:hypothetical protein
MRGFPYRFLIEPAMLLAEQLDIGQNPDPEALYDARGGCINVWCTPEDNPGGDWNKIKLTAGAHCKPSEFVGTISWEWDEKVENVIALTIDTVAYELKHQLPDKYTDSKRVVYGKTLASGFGKLSIYNREDDLNWVEKKAKFLFGQLGLWKLVPVHFKTEKI